MVRLALIKLSNGSKWRDFSQFLKGVKSFLKRIQANLQKKTPTNSEANLKQLLIRFKANLKQI